MSSVGYPAGSNVVHLRNLRSFLTLAEELSFTRAAARIGISQPALSQRIQKLEHGLGIQLLRRSTRGWDLTEAGEQLARDARIMVRRLDEVFEDAARTASGEGGELIVGYVPSTPTDLLVNGVEAFSSDSPKVRVSLRHLDARDVIAHVRDGMVDVGLVRAAPHGHDLWLTSVLSEPVGVALPPDHPLRDRPSVGLAELADERFIIVGRGGESSARGDLIAACAQHGYRPEIARESTVELALAFVARGHGIALVPRSMAPAGSKQVSWVPAEMPPSELVAATNPARQRKAVALIVDAFRRASHRLIEEDRAPDGTLRAAGTVRAG